MQKLMAEGQEIHSSFLLNCIAFKVIKVTQTNTSGTFSLICNTLFLVMFLDNQQCNE